MKMDIVISGVGGQGNIFASLVISQYAMNKKLNVLGAETIGAAQRGGAVVSHIRISDAEIYSSSVKTSRSSNAAFLSMVVIGRLGGDASTGSSSGVS